MFKRHSIRFRLTAWYALSLAFVLGLAAFAGYLVTRASMYRAVDVDLRYRLSGVEEFLQAQHSVDELKKEIVEEGTLGVLFQVYDDSGRVIFQSQALAEHSIEGNAPPLAGDEIAFRDAGVKDWRVRLAAQRMSFAGSKVVVEVAQPMRFHYATLREFKEYLLISLPLLIAAAALVGYWLAGRALKPVDQIIEDARAIDSSRLSQRLSVPPANDELRKLSETLNSMLDRIEASMTRIRQFTGDASHELRAPLTLIQTAAEFSLRRERSREEMVEALEKVLRETKRTSELIDNLLLLARSDSEEEVILPGPVVVNEALREALDRAKQLASSKSIGLRYTIEEVPVFVSGETALLNRLFFILIDNAIKYTPQNGSVQVSLHSDSEAAVVSVEDSGIGIAEEDLPRVFDRFWRADKVRSRNLGGTGLGLSIAKWIAEKSGADIKVESSVGSGTKFEVRFPVVKNREAEAVVAR